MCPRAGAAGVRQKEDNMATTQTQAEDGTDLAGFQTFLADRRLARENQIPHFARWVRRFLWHCGGDTRNVSPDSILTFRRVLENETALHDWQVRQADNAVAIYLHQFLRLDLSEPAPVPIAEGGQGQAVEHVLTWPIVLEQARTALRLRHYSYNTEKTYLNWIGRFARYIEPSGPREATSSEVKHFLTHLAVKRHVSASTQNQAFSALLFLFRHVLRRDLGDISGTVRAKRGTRLPVVLSREEVKALLACMEGLYLLMARLVYGAGLRLRECLRLRVKDLDFANGTLFVRSGKGGASGAVPTVAVGSQILTSPETGLLVVRLPIK